MYLTLAIVAGFCIAWAIFRRHDPVTRESQADRGLRRQLERTWQDEQSQLENALEYGGAFFMPLAQMEVFKAFSPMEQMIVRAMARYESLLPAGALKPVHWDIPDEAQDMYLPESPPEVP